MKKKLERLKKSSIFTDQYEYLSKEESEIYSNVINIEGSATRHKLEDKAFGRKFVFLTKGLK